MEFNMGSNTIRNTNGVIKAEGKDQILLELGPNSELLLTMDIYDTNGVHVAKVIRNVFAFDYKDRYRITAKPTSLVLIEKEHKTVVLEATVTDRDKIQVIQGAFYSSKGHLIEINRRCWKVMGSTISGMVFDSHGGAITLGT